MAQNATAEYADFCNGERHNADEVKGLLKLTKLSKLGLFSHSAHAASAHPAFPQTALRSEVESPTLSVAEL